jgi:hypothetical protein
MPNLDGVGKDAPTIVDHNGFSQSESPYRFDLMPPLAIASVAKILKHGADKYGAWSFLLGSPDDHLNHAIQHIFAYIAQDTTEIDGDILEHMRHAACRILFTLEVLERRKDQFIDPMMKDVNHAKTKVHNR